MDFLFHKNKSPFFKEFYGYKKHFSALPPILEITMAEANKDVVEYKKVSAMELGTSDEPITNGSSKISLSPTKSSMFDTRKSADVEWSNMNFVVGEKKILTDCWGEARSKEGLSLFLKLFVIDRYVQFAR